jgi:hypothetical protein
MLCDGMVKNVLNTIIMTARPHPPGDIEVMRNNESHWSGLNS